MPRKEGIDVTVFKYKTKQREAILNYLRKNTEPLTSSQLAAVLQKKGYVASLTTCYRHLEALYREGRVEKYFLPNEKSAYYRFVFEEDEKDVHFHLKCINCGRLDHMTCDQTVEIMQHIFKEHGFQIDFEMTFIYGLCKFCQS
ncbi:transcriptional regulator, Fur family [Amygdalobacter nucleatus]|uniref:Transcriptional regulator, Fur family n=1 Tax=Amygdalobacter nucleatus TaxID=3029274 RepID=A0A133YHN7_9FIRM|nr:transcriptional regulator, Fur family [Amygdalobacter nucleatus]